MTPGTYRKPRSESKPHIDRERDPAEAAIENSGETADSGRDLVHGEGGTIDLPARPGDLSKDD